ncbi:uncharacterized mitochondrial protein-like protein [Tanacetum coccineum]
MDSDKYLEGQSMQRPPLFESDSFIYWKNRFETYVKSKDLDLWHVITNGDFQPIVQNPETKLDEVIPFEKQTDDLKKRLAKNNEAKMVIYNALPRKEYERIFMCNTAKEIWKTLLITHQGLSLVSLANATPDESIFGIGGDGMSKACDDAVKLRECRTVPGKDYILLPMWPADLLFSHNSKNSPDAGFKPSREEEKMDTEDPGNESEIQLKERYTNNVNVVSSTVSAAFIEVNVVDPKKIEEEVYVCQPPGFEDPSFPDRVYKVEKALYDDIIFGSTKKKLCTEFEKMMHKKFQMSSMGELTFFLGLDVKTTSTPMETHKPLLKDAEGEDVDEYMYRSMIGSLMYLTSSRPDIIYLKGQSKLGLWYPKDSPFDLVAYTDSDYAGASLDRKSTTGGCQFLGCRLISWQYKKQIVVANSITEVEYVAASSCFNAGDSKLMLLGINLLLLEKVNAARHNLLLLVEEMGEETTKTTQAKEIASLKKRVKKLERKRKSKTPGMKILFKVGRSAQVVSYEDEGLGDQEDASKQGRKITDIDQDAKVTLVDETQGRYDDAQMFDTYVFNGKEVFFADQSEKVVKEIVSTAEVVVQEPVQSTTTTAPSTIPKAKSITFRDPGESTTRTTLTPIPSNIKDKCKAKMIEPEKPLKMKEQIRLNEELVFKLQAEEEEQARLAREKAEKEELTDEEKARLFVELLEKRKKYFAALRAQEKRNKPPTKA